MTAEITSLVKRGKLVEEASPILIEPEGINGAEIGIRYLIDGLGQEGRHPGILHVHPNGTYLRLFTPNWVGGVRVRDVDDDGRVKTLQNIYLGKEINLRVIQTEIWLDDIGVRVKHLD